MKDDMTGAAGVLGAFSTLANLAAHGLELAAPVFAALCLAENCIGPRSYRPDDIMCVRMMSSVVIFMCV
jgi:probable aminopeptidase NPEPL1